MSGVGFLIKAQTWESKHHVPMGTYPSVFQAEVMAINLATIALLDRKTQDSNITIFSDSQASLLALSSLKISSHIVRETWTNLETLASVNCLQLKWIPGHSDFVGNEIADKLAREGSSTHFHGPEPFICIPAKTCMVDIDTWMELTHHKEYMQHNSCRQSKEFCQAQTRKITSDLLDLGRQDLRLCLQILTGHGNVAKYQNLLKSTISPICPYCKEEEETAFHHIGKCPVYALPRRYHLGNFEMKKEDFKSTPIKKILAFLRETKRLDKPPG
jgi:ribonuclease HI